jgi:hypothetical protein
VLERQSASKERASKGPQGRFDSRDLLPVSCERPLGADSKVGNGSN